jgi:hypothetical protein
MAEEMTERKLPADVLQHVNDIPNANQQGQSKLRQRGL